MDPQRMDGDLLKHPLVPVANEEDARALRLYSPESVTVLHVVEEGEGVADETPVEQSEALAQDVFAAIRAEFPDVDGRVAYARDVVSATFDAADEIDTDAIVYRPRGGNRITQFRSCDRSLRRVTDADRPVIALPRVDPDE